MFKFRVVFFFLFLFFYFIFLFFSYIVLFDETVSAACWKTGGLKVGIILALNLHPHTPQLSLEKRLKEKHDCTHEEITKKKNLFRRGENEDQTVKTKLLRQ